MRLTEFFLPVECHMTDISVIKMIDHLSGRRNDISVMGE